MPPRIAYWTSAFDPHMEAVASEVALLRRHFPGSLSWGLHSRHWCLLSPQRGCCLHPRLHLLFRFLTRMLGPLFDLNHIVGSVGDWFYLQGARRQPTVLTVATGSNSVAQAQLERVDRFVVEHPGGYDELHRLGIKQSSIRMILPPVDLTRFQPTPPPSGPFTVLFASSPDDEAWLEARGVPQLLEAAALRPAMHFRLLWRPWGSSLGWVRRVVAERGLRNVEIVEGVRSDMAAEYRQAHVTTAPFTDLTRCKPAPNSVIESLACGRPVLVSPLVGLAPLIAEDGVGLVATVTGSILAEHLDRLQANWSQYAQRARQVAEQRFAASAFVAGYTRLYTELLSH